MNTNTSTFYRAALSRVEGLSSFNDRDQIEEVLAEVDCGSIAELRRYAQAEEEGEVANEAAARAEAERAAAESRFRRIEESQRCVVRARAGVSSLENEEAALLARKDRIKAEMDRRDETIAEFAESPALREANGLFDGSQVGSPQEIQSYDNECSNLVNVVAQFDHILPRAIKILDNRIADIRGRLKEARSELSKANKALEQATR